MYYRIFYDNFNMIKIGKKLTSAEIGEVYAYKFLLDAGTLDEIMGDEKFNKKIYGVKFIGDITESHDEKMNPIAKGIEIEIIGFIEPREIKILHNANIVMYFKDKKLHNDDKPAIVCTKGYIEFYKDGLRHRDRGPAYADSSGLKKWYKNDKLHNENGPAILDRNGRKEYYIHGKKIKDYKLYYKNMHHFDQIDASHGVFVNKFTPIDFAFPMDDNSIEKFNIIESHLISRTPNTSPVQAEMEGLKILSSPQSQISIISDYIKNLEIPNILLLD
jgi:hypothetical protein